MAYSLKNKKVKEGNKKLWEDINEKYPKKSLRRKVKLYSELKL